MAIFCKRIFTFIYFFIFWTNISSLIFALDESELDKIGNKIKTNKYCKNFLNAVCCVDDVGIFTSGINSDTTVTLPRYSTSEAEFLKVAIFQGLNIQSMNELAQLLQNKNIETLKIVGSPHLTIIGQSALSHYRSLQTLDLSHNSITFQSQTETYAFFHTNITELNLSHNKIGTTDILMKSLEHLRNLRILYLNNNRNLNFGQYAFPASLGRLKFLDLSYCHIWDLKENVFNYLVNLKNLHLEGNALSSIPKSLCIRPSSLQLNLAKTHIDKNYQKHIQKNCTVKTSFELSMPSEKSFRIVDDDRWNLSVWFYLLCLSAIFNVGLFFAAFFVIKKKIFKEKLNCL